MAKVASGLASPTLEEAKLLNKVKGFASPDFLSSSFLGPNRVVAEEAGVDGAKRFGYALAAPEPSPT